MRGRRSRLRIGRGARERRGRGGTHAPSTTLQRTVIAGLAARFVTPVSCNIAILGGLIVLVPGLALTTATTEISTRHVVSGTARLTGAIVLFFTIAFGVALGTRVAEALVGPFGVVAPVPLPAWTLLPALLAAPASFAVLFRARPRELPWILVAVALVTGPLLANVLVPPRRALQGECA